ncbi:MAG: RagB/SusD family nutrient uptake outer membrane protein [Bacteroidaceae bacterium]|nr:RagB/SusD family nutrient uptake outer membrane protein [Bacteroidaceae bacterium]
MKNIFKYIGALGFGVLAAGALTSCNNNEFLTVNEYEKLPLEYMYKNDETAKQGVNGIYKLMTPYDNTDGDWGFKPNLFTGCHPTLDTQATGWDKDWLQQNWNSSSGELLNGWKHCYAAIARANDFLAGLETSTGVSAEAKKVLAGEAKALRGFFYHWLTITFRRVPYLGTGENYINTPTKARCKTDEEMWKYIIQDFKDASEALDWKPAGGEYGRCTKGMALTYLGDAYMWLAYRYPDKALGEGGYYDLARKCFEQVKNSGTYKLVPSFTTLWDVKNPWNEETIWAEILDNTNWHNTWGDGSARMYTKFYCGSNANGGWGSLFLSWEWYASFEKGDKRRDGSACTGEINQIRADRVGQWDFLKSEYCFGKNPYLNEPIPYNALKDPIAAAQHDSHNFHNGAVEKAPSIWTLKLWRNASAATDAWGEGVHQSNTIYWKRYANVLIDLAECYFRLKQYNEGWDLLNKIRDRANGILEVGMEKELEDTFFPPIQSLTAHYQNKGKADNPTPKALTAYPIPFGKASVDLPDAETYYTALQKSGPTWFDDGTAVPYNCEPWLLALNMERRKEFNTEWCLRPDMQRSGFMEEHIRVNYPKNHVFPGGDNTNSPWFKRDFDYNPEKMDMPIPADELIKNPECDQNPAYISK